MITNGFLLLESSQISSSYLNEQATILTNKNEMLVF